MYAHIHSDNFNKLHFPIFSNTERFDIKVSDTFFFFSNFCLFLLPINSVSDTFIKIYSNLTPYNMFNCEENCLPADDIFFSNPIYNNRIKETG